MEDILASIRRILNEDDVPPGAALEDAAPEPAQATEPAPPADDNGPLVLTEDMMVGGTPEPPPAPDPEPPVVVVAEPPPLPPPAPLAPTPEPAPVAPPLSADALLAPAVAAAAAASVSQLVRAVASERGSAVHRGGPSIEDVVREELRPLLKEWLDQHLPGIVDRLVRAEIERVVGRALS
jgi:cell pole-organizing protein PopZ